MRNTFYTGNIMNQVFNKPWDINHESRTFTPKEQIEAFKTFIEAFNSLAWVEHTCDWDPYIRVTLLDGTIHNAGTGYTEIIIEDEEPDMMYIIQMDDDHETEPINLGIPVSNIQSLQILEP